jgi:RimJ/RimL family protein N-acetyltransferase
VGKHIILRHIVASDAHLYHSWLENSDFLAYKPYLKQLCPTPEHLMAFLAMQIQSNPRTEFEVLVIHKATQTIIGIIGLSGIDEFNKKAEFSAGFIRGYGTRSLWEAIHATITFSFERFQLHKLICYVTPDNHRVLTMMQHYNFISEGCFKEEIIMNNNQRVDLHRFALMFRDWKTHPLRQRLNHIVPIAHPYLIT